MITSTLAHLHRYKGLHPNLDTAIDWVLRTDLYALEDGQFDIEGQEIYAFIRSYETKRPEACIWENHRQYSDIQILLQGPERFGWTPLTGQEPVTPFRPGGDVAFYAIPAGDQSFVTLQDGQFILFFPEDIHQPDGAAGEPAPVRKMVVKVRTAPDRVA